MFWLSVLAGIGGVAAILHALVVMVRSKTPLDWWTTPIMVLLGLYGIGLYTKIAVFGPEFVRFHLADLGFPSAVVVGLAMMLRISDTVYTYSDFMSLLRKYQRLALCAVGVSITYEIVIGLLLADVTIDGLGVGGFDPMDVLAYIIGGAVMTGSFEWCWRWANTQRTQALLAEETARQAKIEQRRAAKARKNTSGARKRSVHNSTPRKR